MNEFPRWLICGKWPLTLYVGSNSQRGADRPYHSRPLWDISREALCKEALLRRIQPPTSVVDLFGGLGVGATILRELYHPPHHWLYELDADCCQHLYRNGFSVARADSYQQNPPPCDLIDADFDGCTALKIIKESPLKAIIEQLFTTGHRQIITTDTAIGKFHLNRPYYEKHLGKPLSSFREYLTAFSSLIHSWYGYSITAAEYHSGAAYLLWTLGKFPLSSFNKTEASYAGISSQH